MMLAPYLALLVLLSDAPATPYAPLANRGFVTDRATAERAIGFRPFVPDPNPVQVALVPPFHGGQLSANEGIAYAYGHRGRDWIMQEWPRNGGSLAAFAALPAEPRCADVHAIGGTAKLRGVAWTTPRGIVMALTPDGAAEPRTILGEFRRLVRRGACR
ncbi:MAG: hypothetical protein JO225_02630 [Candidatus Eremiobacteraeota bacterium]|nr:hypothetical protein [Candidatus Eremiobacteraeota bacterium]MBV8642793.1 hypothetical protein [Candidatus Eremiobacteraeota bacterium]